MKTRPDMPRSPGFLSMLRSSCLFVLVAAVGAQSYGQSVALTESTKALYRGDYVQAAALAEKHLRLYPKDVSVRLILARAELAQGKFQEAFEGLQKALASDPKNVDALY